MTTGGDLSRVYFAPLKWTAAEAQAIRSLFPETRLLTGAQATEAALKRAAAPRFLHIATHGFFLDDQPVKLDAARGSGGLRTLDAKLKIENPLLRSGLAPLRGKPAPERR